LRSFLAARFLLLASLSCSSQLHPPPDFSLLALSCFSFFFYLSFFLSFFFLLKRKEAKLKPKKERKKEKAKAMMTVPNSGTPTLLVIANGIFISVTYLHSIVEQKDSFS